MALALLRIGRPVAEWWVARWAERKQEEEHRARRMRLLRRTFLASCLTLAGVFVLALGVKALVYSRIVSVSGVVAVTGADLPRDAHGHLNLLLLGQGDESHDGVDLTDTMIIASLDPEETHSAVMLSIPRDLYVRTQKMGSGRINNVYRDYKYWLMHNKDLEKDAASQEAMKELAGEVGALMGVDIHGVLKVDFIGFVQAVDALGGVEVDVPYDIVDREYPGPNYGYQTFSISKGLQTLDGETALKYARSRHTTSDFSRSGRQQQIIKQLGAKVKEEGVLSNPSRLLSLMKIMENHVESTLSLRELVGLGGVGMRLDQQRVLSIQLTNEEGSPGGFLYNPPRADFGGASVLLPYQWKNVRTFVRLVMNMRTPYLPRSAIRVLNAGAPSGAGRRIGFELLRYGFDVIDMANAEGEDRELSSIEPGSADDAATVDFLAETLGMAKLPAMDTTGIVTGTGARLPVTITLGKDYVYKDFPSLLPGFGDASSVVPGQEFVITSSGKASSGSSVSAALSASAASAASSEAKADPEAPPSWLAPTLPVPQERGSSASSFSS